MIRKIFYLTEFQVEELQELSTKTGMSMAEHVRRAIDSYLDIEGQQETEDLQRLLDERMSAEFGNDWFLFSKKITQKRLDEIWQELTDSKNG